MTPENFVYWLQGFLEISSTKNITEKQVQIIQDHIGLVLTKVTPDRSGEIEGLPSAFRLKICGQSGYSGYSC